ncbi:hypothetical protein PT279_02705 [Bifidobacterium sp. ESL0784]|uniref:hypothetical protein n=1 Tax=Bifidobacterium sp. ESL0784 TaxID=2983231 RepID=UPI0023F94EA3|nr:hypothetical protein [Bifidobacterium sp. ESL0784]MDF7640502.1 hypothetical protein [Bifidobacterium sp. ESL0784]
MLKPAEEKVIVMNLRVLVPVALVAAPYVVFAPGHLYKRQDENEQPPWNASEGYVDLDF